MGKFLSARDILGVQDKVERKEVESAGGWVNIKEYSPSDRERIADFVTAASKTEDKTYRVYDYQAMIMELVFVQEDGKTPLFTPEDLDHLRSKSDKIWKELWQLVEETNPAGTRGDVQKAKENLSEPQEGSLDSK